MTGIWYVLCVNNVSGTRAVYRAEAEHCEDAKVEALASMFHTRGWRSVSAVEWVQVPGYAEEEAA